MSEAAGKEILTREELFQALAARKRREEGLASDGTDWPAIPGFVPPGS